MGTIITTATIMAFYLNSASNIESPYYYNADIDNGQVKTMYVFDRQGESLIGKAEYRYEYDAEGRVTVKEAQSLRIHLYGRRLQPGTPYVEPG